MELDRYNRLKVLNEYGYDIDWSSLSDKKVVIVGLGGLGAVSVSHLARFGVGKLVLIDYDKVDEVNLNRLFFNPEDIGSLKVEITKNRIKRINPSIQVEIYAKDVMAIDFEETFENICKEMDLLIMGVDNFPARHHLNVCCIDSDLPYIDAGANRNGLGGWVHPVIPRKTACYACVGTIKIGSNTKEEPCTASLPTTMAILASIQAQEAIKLLIGMGKLIDYLYYDAMTGEFILQESPKNNNCYVCGTQKVKDTLNDWVKPLEVDSKGIDQTNAKTSKTSEKSDN
jgi:molybdopterin/thiamine biosynthesis adenylyltransferase